MTQLWAVATFYRFFEVEEPARLADQIRKEMERRAMVGLVIVAEEGINGTVAHPGDLAPFEAFVEERVPGPLRFKRSRSTVRPFRRAVVDVRHEIVTLRSEAVVHEGAGALDVEEWDGWLRSDRPKLLIDARNRYETEVGKFRGAIDPGIDRFSQWPAFVESLREHRSTPVLIYCTGGIRCEKAAVALREAGFGEVYQLKDGILGYFEHRPDGGEFEGECFVFDERVALDSHLEPSRRFALCAQCGRPVPTGVDCRHDEPG